MLPAITCTTEWRPVKGLEERYAVSEYGHVINIQAWNGACGGRQERYLGYLLKPQPDRAGYVKYFLNLPRGVKTSVMAHSLVYRSFVGELPPNKELDHKDNNKWNNHYSNLEPLTHQQNQQKANKDKRFRPPRGEYLWDGRKNKNAKLTEVQVKEIRHLFDTGQIGVNELGKRYGVSHVNISHIVWRRTWRYIQ